MSSPVEALYAEVPEFECRGLCQESCGAISMTAAERRRVEQHTGRKHEPSSPCQHLGPMGQCTIYDVRPLVCRLWGLSPMMRCPHGCRVVMEDAEAFDLMERAWAAGGTP